MMSSLFSSFDPTTTFLSLNWMSLMLIFILIPNMYWLIPSRMNILWIKLLMKLNKEFKILLNENQNHNKNTLIFISLFSIIIMSNFFGLFPYIFTSTSHPSINLSLALPLWMSMIIFGMLKKTNLMMAHLVPQGTPILLIPFMVCIETISIIIRPGTLAIRLTANMMAGHLLMTLLGNMGNLISTYMISMLIIIQMLLLMLELAVSILQSYVFTVLSVLYCSEV
uniref:ATP synthase subunit a n=1 Tax=Arescus labiatus TaxID=294769 RepID=U3L083_9CUCU|nr:ATP synthase F0 subunit 6 [Arescus labiatus]